MLSVSVVIRKLLIHNLFRLIPSVYACLSVSEVF